MKDDKVHKVHVDPESDRAKKIYELAGRLMDVMTEYQEADTEGDNSQTLSETFTALFISLETGLMGFDKETSDFIIDMHVKEVKERLDLTRERAQAALMGAMFGEKEDMN